MTVLVAADLSVRSEYAITRACQMAKTVGKDVRALHVVDGSLREDFRKQAVDWAKKSLTAIAEEAATCHGVTVTPEIRQGHPRKTLIEQSNSDDITLLVFGVHSGDEKETRSFSKTTAGQALAGSIPPALLVTEKPGDDYRNVVVGIDFTLSSRAAIRQAITLAPEAKIHLVHAYHPPFIGLSASPMLAEEVAYQHKLEFDRFLTEEMALLEDQAKRHGAMADSVNRIIEAGTPEAVLRGVCKKVDADLTVIATHGKGMFSRAIWGSVAANLLDNPPCDVLVIKPF